MTEATDNIVVISNFPRRLGCVLDDSEVAEKATVLAGLIVEQQEVEQDKATVAADFNAKLKKINGQVRDIAKIVKAREEERSVECEKHIDAPRGSCEIVRTDTGEIIETSAASVADMETAEQRKLFTEDADAGDGPEDPGSGDSTSAPAGSEDAEQPADTV